MFNKVAKTAQRMAPMLRRVLIVDPQPNSSRALGELLREVCLPAIWAAPTAAKALKLADKVDPQLIFCTMSGPGVDGAAFTRTPPATRATVRAERSAAEVGVASAPGAGHYPMRLIAPSQMKR